MSDSGKSSDHREFDRKDILFGAKLNTGTTSIDCEIVNISFGGVQAHVNKMLDYGESVTLEIDPFGTFTMEVRWFDNENIGLRFEDDRVKVSELVMAIATYA